MMRAGAEKCPRQPYQTLARVIPEAGAVTSRYCYKVGMQILLEDVPRVEFVDGCVVVVPREHNGRIKRDGHVCRGVSNKMYIGKLARLAELIRLRGCLCACQDGATIGRKMTRDIPDLGGGVWEFCIFVFLVYRVAHDKNAFVRQSSILDSFHRE